MFDPIPMPDLTTLPAACAAEGIDLDSDEAPIDVVPALTPDVLDTIRLALKREVEIYTPYLASRAGTGAYWAGELWQIDRARRALGLED